LCSRLTKPGLNRVEKPATKIGRELIELHIGSYPVQTRQRNCAMKIKRQRITATKKQRINP
jgi:hypothetical protein